MRRSVHGAADCHVHVLKSRLSYAHATQEVKEYGTKKAIEGAFEKGQTCLLVEDLVTSGMSVMETVRPLQHVGLKTTDVVVLIDRARRGSDFEEEWFEVARGVAIEQSVESVKKEGKMSKELVEEVQQFIAANQTGGEKKEEAPKKRETYTERAKIASNQCAKDMFHLMDKKKSNLCVAADVDTAKELLELAETLGPEICMLKTHCDLYLISRKISAKIYKRLLKNTTF